MNYIGLCLISTISSSGFLIIMVSLVSLFRLIFQLERSSFFIFLSIGILEFSHESVKNEELHYWQAPRKASSKLFQSSCHTFNNQGSGHYNQEIIFLVIAKQLFFLSFPLKQQHFPVSALAHCSPLTSFLSDPVSTHSFNNSLIWWLI